MHRQRPGARIGSYAVKMRDGDKGRSSFLEGFEKAEGSMPAKAILQEARRLRTVSHNLHELAERYAPLTEALAILSGSVRNSAALLEVLVALKLGAIPRPDLEIN